jgi:hypothetical protein
MKKVIFDKEKILYITGICLVVFSLILYQVLLISKGFYSISADEAGHILEGFWWYKGATPIFSIWLPFQKILYGLLFHIYYNLFWSPRILNSVFGILTLTSLINLTQELFQNKIVTLLSGFLGSIFWGIIIFSVIPLTEIYFFFFEISSLGFFLHWNRTNDRIFLYLTIIFLCFSSTIRYEAWIFIFSIFVALVYNIVNNKKVLKIKVIQILGIGALLFSFPLIWMYLSYINGSAANFINSIPGRYSRAFVISEIKNNVCYHFVIINGKTLNILGFISLIFYNGNKKIKVYAYIFISTIIMMEIILFITKANMPTHNSWRLATIWSIMLLPFTAKWLHDLFMEEKGYLKITASLIFLFIIFSFNKQTMDFSSHSFTTIDDIKVGEYIYNKINLEDPNSKILIEKNGWKYTNILVSSQVPDRFITSTEFLRNIMLTSNSINYNKSIIENFYKYKIRLLILKPNSQLIHGVDDLMVLKKFKDWIIFKPI